MQINSIEFSKGESTPMHMHEWPHDVFVVRGKLKLDVGSIVHELDPGSVVHCPGGADHQLTALEDDTIVITQHPPEA